MKSRSLNNSREIQKVELSETQLAYYNDKHRFVIGTGGVGCGKTFVACYKVFKYVMDNPGVRFLAAAYTINQVAWVLVPFLQKIIDIAYIANYNKTMKVMDFWNGSQIIFKSLDTEAALKGINLGGAYIDELTEMKFDVVERLMNNIRDNKFPCQFFATTNSDTYEHWLYREYIDPTKWKNGEKSSLHNFYTLDNIHLSKQYIDRVLYYKEHAPEYYKKQYEGGWGSRSGLVYELKAENIYDEDKLFRNYIVGVDFGHSHPFAVVVLGVELRDGQECFYVVEEYREKGLSFNECYEVMEGIEKRYKPDIVFCEHQPAIIVDLNDRGLNAVPAPKGQHSVAPGIGRIRALLNADRLYIHKNCAGLRKEFGNYRYKEMKNAVVDVTAGEDLQHEEKPVKINDDLLDALRYAMQGYFDGESFWTAQELREVTIGV